MNVRSAILLLTVLAYSASGQTPPRFGKTVRSPEVSADGRITFRFRAPNASKVVLNREGSGPVPMIKDEQGTWSFTTPPLPPDLYTYTFFVDGVELADPANPRMSAVATGGIQSIAHVPGPATLSWEPGDVPHGVLHRHTYRSTAVGESRDFYVYTPPGYDPARRQTYPTLYLLHGVMDDASAWSTAGQACVILDNLVAWGKAKPMVVVMPLGYGFPNVPDGMSQQFAGPAIQRKLMDRFATTLLDEILPMVERSYRVEKNQRGRAIAGLSMGGAQALYLGLNHPEAFRWVGCFSGAYIMYGQDLASWFPGVDQGRPVTFDELTIACGTEDFLLPSNRRVESWLKAKGVRFTAVETPGAHTWNVWRRNLTEFAPLLFR